MDIKQVINHWKYFLSLEKDLIELRDFIEFNKDNFHSYSFEISKLLQLTCSEIDSVCRNFCNVIDPSTDYFDETTYSGKINLYKQTIINKYPKLIESKIEIPDLFEEINPWDDWKTKDSPEWWKSYNKVKHYRHSCFKDANLKNALYSLSALMILNLYLYRIIDGHKYANPNIPTKYLECKYCSPALTARADSELPDFE